MNKLKKFLSAQAERANSTRGTLIALVGGYIAYLGYQMLQDTRSGVSSMSLSLTIAFMIVMFIIGAAVFAYGAYLFWAGWKKEKETIPKDENHEEDVS